MGLITGEVGAGKSTAARLFTATLNTNLYKNLYVDFSSGSALDLLRQIALELDLEPAHFRGDPVRQIADAVVRLNQRTNQHPILICDEAHLLPHPALEQLPLLLNFDMDSSRYLTLLLVGQPLLRRTLSLQMHEVLRRRIGVQYHLEGLTRDELDAYLAQQLKAAGVSQPLFDATARHFARNALGGAFRMDFLGFSRGIPRSACTPKYPIPASPLRYARVVHAAKNQCQPPARAPTGGSAGQ